jgi:hypothetical protein
VDLASLISLHANRMLDKGQTIISATKLTILF